MPAVLLPAADPVVQPSRKLIKLILRLLCESLLKNEATLLSSYTIPSRKEVILAVQRVSLCSFLFFSIRNFFILVMDSLNFLIIFPATMYSK